MLNILMLGGIPPPYGGVTIHVENLCRELSTINKIYLLADRPLDYIKYGVYNGYKVYRPLVTIPSADAPIRINDFFQTVLLNMRGYGLNCIKLWSEYLIRSSILIHYGLRTEMEMLYASPLHEILKTQDIDVIHAHHAAGRAFRALLACRLARKHIPLVVTMHRGELTTKSEEQKNIIRFIFLKASKLVAVSSYIKEKAIKNGAPKDKIIVIHNGVNTNLFKSLNRENLRSKYGFKNDDIIVLFVGNLERRKGIEELVKTFIKIEKYNRILFLVIVGKGPLITKLLKIINASQLIEKIVFMSNLSVSELIEVYNIADIFTLPSYEEGLSGALLEAMSCGKPILTTYPSSSLSHDAIKDGYNGLLVRAGDLNALSNKLQFLIDDVKIRKKLGKNARRTAIEKFDWSIIADKIDNLYMKIVE